MSIQKGTNPKKTRLFLSFWRIEASFEAILSADVVLLALA